MRIFPLFCFALVSLYASKELYTDKPFYYLTSGTQAKVYRSSDAQIVLKRLDPPLEHQGLSFKGLLRRAEKRYQKRLKAFKSYVIAYTQFREMTGLIHLHLRPGGWNQQKAWLVDERPHEEFLSLNRAPFLIQKYATSLSEEIEQVLQESPERAIALLNTILTLMESIANKGYYLRDPNILKNWGITREGPILIDVGEFESLRGNKNARQVELMYEKALFPVTIAYPDLTPYIEHWLSQKDLL